MTRGKHRARTYPLRRALGATAGAVLATGASVGVAQASTHHHYGYVDWDAIAECESSGNWHANTGNGYYGGLQFTLSTWHSYGGDGAPNHHSREQQITIAKRVLDGQGLGAWPVCGHRGLTRPPPAPAHPPVPTYPPPGHSETPRAAPPVAGWWSE